MLVLKAAEVVILRAGRRAIPRAVASLVLEGARARAPTVTKEEAKAAVAVFSRPQDFITSAASAARTTRRRYAGIGERALRLALRAMLLERLQLCQVLLGLQALPRCWPR